LTATLIISTYNWPEALDLVLLSILEQNIYPLEVIIADDGSSKSTANLIESYKSSFPVSLKHVWHEDNGFRKTAILNKAIALAEGNYIIQADGDCILHRNFVKDHVSSAIPGLYLYGSRVNIKEQHLSYLFKKKQVHFKVFSKGIKKRTRALHIGLLSKLYKPSTVFSKKYRGCNTSFYKSDFIAVNGYDEDIKGWGREDSELALRFHNYGLKGKRLRYKGIVFHIFHKEKPKDRLELNNKIEEQTKRLERIKCKTGVTKYL